MYDFCSSKFVEVCFMVQTVSILVNIPCERGKNVHSAVAG